MKKLNQTFFVILGLLLLSHGDVLASMSSDDDLSTVDKRFARVANFMSENFENEQVDEDIVAIYWENLEAPLAKGMEKSNVNKNPAVDQKYLTPKDRMTQAQFITKKGDKGKKAWELVYEPKFLAAYYNVVEQESGKEKTPQPKKVKEGLRNDSRKESPKPMNFEDFKKSCAQKNPAPVVAKQSPEAQKPVIQEIRFTDFCKDANKKRQFKVIFDNRCYYPFKDAGNKKARGVRWIKDNEDNRLYSLVNGFEVAFEDNNAYGRIAELMNIGLKEEYSWFISEWEIPYSVTTKFNNPLQYFEQIGQGNTGNVLEGFARNFF